MNWHDIRDPNDPELDRLAERYGLHPLHVEDCRHRNQNAKVEENGGYLFIVLKPVLMKRDCSLEVSDFDIFLGRDFIITVDEAAESGIGPLLDRARASWGTPRGDQALYRITDALVDTYTPSIDAFADSIDDLQDEVLEGPNPEALSRIFFTKRGLIQMRRVLGNMRDVAAHLQRTENELIGRDLYPFFRDIYDHLARNLDLVETQRDLLSGTLDIYLSSVANRTNQVMKVLTVLGTIALPAIVISGMYGMNVAGLPWKDAPHAFWIVCATIASITAALLFLLRRLGWW